MSNHAFAVSLNPDIQVTSTEDCYTLHSAQSDPTAWLTLVTTPVIGIVLDRLKVKICFSKARVTPVLWFYFKTIKDIPKYFRFNSLGDRIYDFCQSQSCLLYNVVVVTEPELENSRLENFDFYYIRSEEC
ncbi:DUF5838 family protein [Lyngbya sp. PCC 8106]|uniref:DUF5838 family protein n=1 Tax=Lyngbya sp. (strain PCC 8106) TaxID=313612 RepID=UPI0012E9DDD8|nr:DUF5838 family protein [Lyngbya sp. PCC 8106]